MINTINQALRILVIEDNTGDFVLIESYFGDKVKPVLVHAKNFLQASDILSSGDAHFDVILLDLTLPDNSGEKLITDIISLSAGCPVIVLTGYSDIQFSIKSLSLGVADYLIKGDISASSIYKSIIYTIERTRSNKDLQQSEKRYSDLFHLSPVPAWVYDAVNLQFLDVNASAISHYDYSREDFLQIKLLEDVPAVDSNPATGGDEKHPNAHIICRHKKKNGEIIQVEEQSTVIDFKGNRACLMLANDVTERLRYVRAIEVQNNKLQEIAWIQSHLVRAPLAKIMGLVDLIKNHSLSDTEKGDYFIHILNSAEELDGIVKEIVKKTEQAQLNIDK